MHVASVGPDQVVPLVSEDSSVIVPSFLIHAFAGHKMQLHGSTKVFIFFWIEKVWWLSSVGFSYSFSLCCLFPSVLLWKSVGDVCNFRKRKRVYW